MVPTTPRALFTVDRNLRVNRTQARAALRSSSRWPARPWKDCVRACRVLDALLIVKAGVVLIVGDRRDGPPGFEKYLKLCARNGPFGRGPSITGVTGCASTRSTTPIRRTSWRSRRRSSGRGRPTSRRQCGGWKSLKLASFQRPVPVEGATVHRRTAVLLRFLSGPIGDCYGEVPGAG